VKSTGPDNLIQVAPDDKRSSERHSLKVPARLMWKDQRGTTRFASVVTRDISEHGVFVECQSAVSIPLYRLVQFQIERDMRDASNQPLPMALRQGRILSAVYRVTPGTPAGRQGLALRLMVDPKRSAETVTPSRAATA